MQQTKAPLLTQTGEEFLAEGHAIIREAKGDVGNFKALPLSATASEAADALDAVARTLNKVSGRIPLYSQAHPNPGMRETAEILERDLAAFVTALSLDREMYERVAAIDLSEEGEGQVKRLIERSLQDFRRGGVDQDEAMRAKIKNLKNELVEIGQEFDRNIRNGGKDFILVDGEAGLEGLPADFVAAHPVRADGTICISTDAQDRVPFMMFSERSDLRKAYNHLCSQRAVPENLGVLQKLLETSHELATALGFANWADYITADKMAKNGKNARTFIERILELGKERACAENAELLAEKVKDLPQAKELYEYERGYYIERVKRSHYDFDSQLVRPYLAYDKVREGVMSVAARLFGVTFQLNETVERWHASVDVFDMLEDGEVIARLFLDMHPRDDKYKHAAMFDLVTGRDGGPIPEGTLVCNFPEPKEGDPGLMLFDQVTTYFHEFGHLLHYLFSGKQRFQGLAGIATEWDFVEVPSQLFEEWAWDPAILASFATHFATGEPIPAALVTKLRAAEEYGKGLQTNGQMFYAMLALSYYEIDPKGLDTTERMIELKKQIMFSPHEEDTFMQASFGHLHGYSAMYYTYMWSLVISKDFFSKFRGDLMNRETAIAYRNEVTGRGGEVDADVLCSNFLGRKYNFEAFESWLNA
jgi:thimet oligopeptidase